MVVRGGIGGSPHGVDEVEVKQAAIAAVVQWWK
jgi:hypothetical protein